MMDAATIDQAKRVCLKQSFGGSLDAQEQDLLLRYLASEEGRAYLGESQEMKHLLSDVADVRIHKDVDSKAMIASFEKMAREDLREAQPWLPLLLIGCPGVLLAISAYCLSRGDRLEFLGWTLCVTGLAFALLFIALWRQQKTQIEDPNLFRSLEEDRKLGQSGPVIARTWALIGLMYLAMGIGITKAGGFWVLGIAAASAFLTWFLIHRQVQAKLQKHEEFWEWWDGQPDSN